MAIQVTRYDMDPLKSGRTRDYHDANLRRASAELRLTGSVAGMVLTLQSPVPTAPAIVITEGVDWTETADIKESLMLLVSAIQVLSGGLLTSVGDLRVDGTDWLIKIQAASPGSWGEAITLDIDAAGAALEINGTPGATTQNLTNGAGADAIDAFETFLNGLAGAPGIDEIIIVPLFMESSSYLVIWDDVP